jgi:hypothetical protein
MAEVYDRPATARDYKENEKGRLSGRAKIQLFARLIEKPSKALRSIVRLILDLEVSRVWKNTSRGLQ